jgi:hypothetical protein
MEKEKEVEDFVSYLKYIIISVSCLFPLTMCAQPHPKAHVPLVVTDPTLLATVRPLTHSLRVHVLELRLVVVAPVAHYQRTTCAQPHLA